MRRDASGGLFGFAFGRGLGASQGLIGFGDEKLAHVLLVCALGLKRRAFFRKLLFGQGHRGIHVDLIERDDRKRRVFQSGDFAYLAAVQRPDCGHGARHGGALEHACGRLIGARAHEEHLDRGA